MESVKKEISLVEAKSILLQMMCHIDAFCRNNGINYSLGFGTLIGAVRHQGYIPWDDDIDLFMTRDNYEKFQSLYSHDRYRMIYNSKNSKWGWQYIRIHDSKTIVEFQNPYSENLIHGLWIAIIPLDGIPDNKTSWFFKTKAIGICDTLCRLRHAIWNPQVALWKNVVKTIFKPLVSIRSYYYWGNLYTKALRLYESKQASNLFQFELIYYVFPIRIFEKYIDLPFEGHLFMAVAGYDEFLKIYYGDYMQLPPENERIAKHDYKAYYLE